MPDLTFPLEDSVRGKLWQETVAKVQDLSLSGIEPDRVVLRKKPWLVGIKPPCVLVAFDSLTNNPDAGTNERDDLIYRFIVTFLFANERDMTDSGVGIMSHWMEVTRRAMNNKTNNTWPIDLPSGSFLRSTVPDTTTGLLEDAKRQGIDAEYLPVAFLVREPRT